MLIPPATEVWVTRLAPGDVREIWSYSSARPPRRIHARRQARRRGDLIETCWVMTMDRKTGRVALINSLADPARKGEVNMEVEVLGQDGSTLRRAPLPTAEITSWGALAWSPSGQPMWSEGQRAGWGWRLLTDSGWKALGTKQAINGIDVDGSPSQLGLAAGNSQWAWAWLNQGASFRWNRRLYETTEPRFGWSVIFDGDELWRPGSRTRFRKHEPSSAWSTLRLMRHPRFLYRVINPDRGPGPWTSEDFVTFQILMADADTGEVRSLGIGGFMLCVKDDGGTLLGTTLVRRPEYTISLGIFSPGVRTPPCRS